MIILEYNTKVTLPITMHAHCTGEDLCPTCVQILELAVDFDVQAFVVSLPLSMQDNYSLWKFVLGQNPCALRCAPDTVRGTYDLVEWCVRKNPLTFRHAREVLRDDFYLAKLAVTGNSNNLRYTSERLRDDLDFVLIALLHDQSGSGIRFCSERARDNLDLAVVSVTRDGLNLGLLSERLRNTYNIVHIACAENQAAIRLASTSMQKKHEQAYCSSKTLSSFATLAHLSTIAPAGFLHHRLYQSLSKENMPTESAVMSKIITWKRKHVAYIASITLAGIGLPVCVTNLIAYGVLS